MTVAAETGKRRRGRAAKRHGTPKAAFNVAWRR